MNTEEMGLFDSTFGEMGNIEDVRTEDFETVSQMMARLGYSYMSSRQAQNSPKIDVPWSHSPDQLAKDIESSLADGNDVVYFNVEHDAFEVKILSLERTGDEKIQINAIVIEEGDVIESYSYEYDSNSFEDVGSMLGQFTSGMWHEDEKTKNTMLPISLNALGITKGQKYVPNEGYQTTMQFNFVSNYGWWFHNDMFIPLPFNMTLPQEFIANLRKANAKV